MNGGRPDCADPQVGAFSPINVTVGLLTGGSLSGFVFYWLLMWWLGGVGVLLLAWEMRAPAWGAGLGALAYATSGVFTSHAEHTTIVVAMALLPWIVWRLDVALRRDSRLAAAQAGAIWGLSALAGYPGLVIVTGFYLGLWTTGRILIAERPAADHRGHPPEHSDRRRRLSVATVSWLIFLLIGVLVLAPTYVAFFSEGEGYSDRVEKLSKEIAVERGALHPGAVATFASPYLALVKLVNSELWSDTDPSMTSIYVSLVALALAWAALWNRPRAAWRWWLCGLAVFFLLTAMGRAFPLRGWLYDFFIPMRFFRHSPIFRGYYIFSMIVLALFAARDLAAADPAAARRCWRRLGVVVPGLGLLAMVAIVSVARVAETSDSLVTAMAWTLVLSLGACMVAVLGPAGGRAPPWIAPWLLVAICAGDAWVSVRFSRWLIQSPDTGPWQQATAAHQAELDLTANGLDRLATSPYGVPGHDNRNLLSKKPTIENEDPFTSFFQRRWNSIPELRDAAVGSDRIWFSPHAVEIEPTRQAFFVFERRARELGVPPLVVHPRGSRSVIGPSPDARGIASLGAMQRIPVKLASYGPNELSFTFATPRDGWLLVTDRFAAGWKVWLDGEEGEMVRGNFLFRAVEVRQGSHRVVFRYQPRGFPGLLVVSWGILLGIALAGPRRLPGRRASGIDPLSRGGETKTKTLTKHPRKKTSHSSEG
ncbi:MAG: YfhO family protein [bacterium]|nr:YfhO family protein [bacterium]